MNYIYNKQRKKIHVHFEQRMAIHLLAHVVVGYVNYHQGKKIAPQNFTFRSVMDDELSKMVITCTHTHTHSCASANYILYRFLFVCLNLNEKQIDID